MRAIDELSEMDIMDMTADERAQWLCDKSPSELIEIIAHAAALINYQRARLAIYSARERCEKERIAQTLKSWEAA